MSTKVDKTQYYEDMEPVNEDYMVAEPKDEGDEQDSDEYGTYPDGITNDE